MARRQQWHDLPPEIKARIEALVGGRVVEARSQEGGYGPGLASRCRLDNSGWVFVKAVSPARNERTPGILRREIEAWSHLPSGLPAASLLAADDDGDWVIAAFEDVDGHMPPPWRPGDLDAAIGAIDRLAAHAMSNPRGLLPAAASHRGSASTSISSSSWRRGGPRRSVATHSSTATSGATTS
jgi:hypothetical protein